ncbi:MAG: hypothetical protein II565_05700 [Fibrobacter sp.]|nr:hypothetical protein [Fibrobacter sp.]MBQ5464084.1 hypothetical protein [Fibrobacter sp.]
MKTKFSRFTLSILIASMFAIAVTTLAGCSLLKKYQAAKILIKTKMEYKDLTFDSVVIDPPILELVEKGLSGFIPNPDAIKLVKDLSQGIINSELGHANFDVFLNAKNTAKDTLWINNFKIELKFDTLITIPLTLKDSMVLAPGDNDMHLNAAFPLDMRIFKLNQVTYYGIGGFLDVSLSAGGESVSQDFEIKRDVDSEEVKKLEDLVRDKLMKMLVEKWLGKIGKFIIK